MSSNATTVIESTETDSDKSKITKDQIVAYESIKQIPQNKSVKRIPKKSTAKVANDLGISELKVAREGCP
jgi:hypothetical protein